MTTMKSLRIAKTLLLGMLSALLVGFPASLPTISPPSALAQASKRFFPLFTSGTRGTTTGTATDISGTNATGCVGFLNVTAQAGTNPTLDVKIQDSPDGTLWFDVPGLTFTQVTASTGQQTLQATRAIGQKLRAIATVGGSATPTFTFSVGVVTYYAPAVEVTTTLSGAATFTSWTMAGANGSQVLYGVNTELLTLSTGGATTDSSANLLPAGAVIDSVQAIVTVAITTATRFTAAGAAAAALGTRISGIDHWNGNITTTAAGPTQASAAKVRVTANGTPGAGQVRLVVFYRQFLAPTS